MYSWHAQRCFTKRVGKLRAESISTILNARLEAERAFARRRATHKFGEDIHDQVSGLLARIGNSKRLRDAWHCCDLSDTKEELLSWLASIVKLDEPYEKLLTDPRMAAGILRVLAAQGKFPTECLERLKLENMTLIPVERTGSSYQKEHLSVVWRIPVRRRGERPIFLLLQYQSESNPETRIHFSEYVTQISAIVGVQEDPKPRDPWPPAVAVVLHDDDKEWDVPTGARPGSVAEQIEAVAGAIRYLVLGIGSCDPDELPEDEPITWWIRARRARKGPKLLTALQGAGRTMPEEEFADLREALLQMLMNRVGANGKNMPPIDTLRAMLNGEVDNISDRGARGLHHRAQNKALKQGREKVRRRKEEKDSRSRWEWSRWSAKTFSESYAENVSMDVNERLEDERTLIREEAISEFGDDIQESVSGLLARIDSFERLHDANIAWADTKEEKLSRLASIIEYNEPFEKLLTDPRMAASMLRVLAARGKFPTDCLERLDLENMTRIPVERTGSQYQKEHLSVVWRVPVRGGGECPIFLLLQFQEEDNPETRIHFSEYVTHISANVGVQEDPGPEDSLPPVLPVVLHDWNGEWYVPTGARPGSVAEQIEAVAGTIRYLVLDMGSHHLRKLPQDEPMTWWIRVRRAESVPELLTALQGAGRTMRREEFADMRESLLQVVTNIKGMTGEGVPPVEALRTILDGECEDANDIEKWGTKHWYKNARDGALKKGLEAQRSQLCRQAKLRFNAATTERLPALLERIDDSDQLAQVAEWLITYKVGARFLARIEKEYPPGATPAFGSSG